MGIDLKQFVKAESNSASTKSGKAVCSINSTSGTLRASQFFTKKSNNRISTAKQYTVLIAKDNKSIVITESKDGKSIGGLRLTQADMKKIGLGKQGFTSQFSARFEAGMILVDLKKSVLCTEHKSKE